MHLSIHTREVDNGWTLDADLPWMKNTVGGASKKELHEVYDNPTQVRERVIGLLEMVVVELKEGIPERTS